MWFAIDTMEFLRRGGRVGAARAWLGSTLKIKPILTVESQITPIERVRTSRRAFERMVEYLRERHDARRRRLGRPAHPGPRRGRASWSSAAARSSAPSPSFVSEIGPVIGTHVGPGLLGVGGVPAALPGRPASTITA